jgi:hypothetical protein
MGRPTTALLIVAALLAGGVHLLGLLNDWLNRQDRPCPDVGRSRYTYFGSEHHA